DEPTPLFNAKASSENVREETGSFTYTGSTFRLEQEGERLPFFQRYQLSVRTDFPQLKVTDREKEGEEAANYWTQNLSHVPYFQNVPRNYNAPQISPRITYKNLGHLVVLQTGHRVFAFDPVNKKQLWEKDLAGSGRMEYRSHAVDARDGSARVVFADGWTQRLGQTGPLSPVAVCLLTTDALVAVDPVGGQVLWTRDLASQRNH